ncbi:MAG: terminase large subunit [Fimbriimonadales bacterium]|nr:terminase large subunit [Fimbriimonadales bacterium]
MIPGWYPHAGQRAFLEARAPIRVLACGRRWGKTEVVAVEVARLLLEPAPRMALLIAPSLEQALIPFERVAGLLRQAGQSPLIRRTPAPVLTLGQSRLWARSAARGGLYLRGRKAHLIVVDEAAYVPEVVVTEVLMPMLSDTGGRLALVSTPRGKNYFYRLYLEGQQGSERVWSLHCPSWQNPLLSPRTLLMQAQLMSERQFQVEYGAAFLDDAGQVFRTEWVDRAVLTRLEPEGLIVAGIDWARYQDWTAVAILQGARTAARMLAIRRWQGLAWAEQVATLARLLEWHGVQKALCDRTGIGDPLVESLQNAVSIPVEGLNFTRAVKQSLVEGLALMLEQGRLQLLPDMTLLQELYHFEASATPAGVRFGAERGFHDDMVIALALAVRALPPAPIGQVQTSGRERF